MSVPATVPLVAHHRVAIAGYVKDAVTQKPIAGAVVTIVDMPDAFKRKLRHAAQGSSTQTRNDGLYYFLDLPDGNYTLQASFPALGRRYGSMHHTAKVPHDPKLGTKVQFVNLALPPTAIQGKVTGKGHKGGVVMARVQVRGSGERALTDENGEYTLSGMEPGKRTVQVFAQGYRAASEMVQIGAGQSSTKDFELLKEAGK